MPVFRLTDRSIEALPPTSFMERGVRERTDLQRLLKANIAVVADGVLIIAEEFAEWDDSKRRIDLLAVDHDANLVVIELKRDDEGAHMELQAIRYAAMVSSMTFDRAAEVYQSFLNDRGQDARAKLLAFLGWDDPREEEFGRDVRIILVAADFSKELTTAVLWLNDRDLDIRCVRLKPYMLGSEVVIDAQQVVPLPEAQEYQIRVREKAISRREAVRQGGEPTGYWFMNTGDGSNEGRAWEDCKKYGFMIAGGGQPWIDAIRKLKVGDKFFAYLSGQGYVGLGEVVAEAIPQKDFVPPGQAKRLIDLPLTAKLQRDRLEDPDRCDWCAAVRWVRAFDRAQGVLRNRARRSTVEQIKKPDLVADLLRHFAPPNDGQSS
jgi:hypothetical protein